MTIRVPRLNVNGTAAQVLVDEYARAIWALDSAIVALLNVTVHGRDYYAMGDHALSDAQREHRGRLAKLNDVRDELQTIYGDILEQNAILTERRYGKTA